MKIKIDRHAKRRMKWREITKEEIFLVLQNPETVEKSYYGRENAFKNLGKRYLRITFKRKKGYLLVISAVDKND